MQVNGMNLGFPMTVSLAKLSEEPMSPNLFLDPSHVSHPPPHVG